MIGIDRKAGSALILPRRLITVHDRQLDIHQDEIRPLFRYGQERLLTVLDFDDLVGGGRQHVTNDLAIICSTKMRLLMPPLPAAQRLSEV
jgi:hypothetical protein